MHKRNDIINSKLWSKCNLGNKPLPRVKIDRRGLTGHGIAVQYNATRQCGSLNKHLPETRTLLSWSTPRLLTIHGLVRPSCEVLQPFIGCNIHPNVLHRGAGTKSELRRSLLYKNVCSKMLSLNNTIQINGNQIIERQFNFTQFHEASVQNEDFGKAFTVKVLFRGEQRWRRFMHNHSLQVSKLYSTQYPKMVDLAATWYG
jgi:hypothetical protein